LRVHVTSRHVMARLVVKNWLSQSLFAES